MQSVSPDYKARKQGKPTMPLKERLYSKIKINEYTLWRWGRAAASKEVNSHAR